MFRVACWQELSPAKSDPGQDVIKYKSQFIAQIPYTYVFIFSRMHTKGNVDRSTFKLR